MEAMVQIHPNQDGSFNINTSPEFSDFEDLDESSDTEEEVRPKVLVPAILKKERFKEMEAEVYPDSEYFSLSDYMKLTDQTYPRFNLDIDKMQVVKFSSELVMNLDLQLTSSRILGGEKTTIFSNDLTFNEGQKKVFKSLVLNRKGYLSEESNYFQVGDKYISEDAHATTLRNTRVILYWHSTANLSDIQVKRILTLGLTFLIGEISRAELIVEIQKELPNGKFDLDLKYEKNRFVFISIKEPIFTF